jgi:hypothetical protein
MAESVGGRVYHFDYRTAFGQGSAALFLCGAGYAVVPLSHLQYMRRWRATWRIDDEFGDLVARALMHRTVYPLGRSAFIDPSCDGFLAWVVWVLFHSFSR